MVVMETSSHVDSHMSYQIVATTFGSVFFNIKNVNKVRSHRRQNPPPPPFPYPGLNRIDKKKKKNVATYHDWMILSDEAKQET